MLPGQNGIPLNPAGAGEDVRTAGSMPSALLWAEPPLAKKGVRGEA